MQNTCAQFIRILSSHKAAIAYSPLKNEPNPETCIPMALPATFFTVSAEPSKDPVEIAQKAKAFFADTHVCIYVPGTAFDLQGVRHGRGGGWYDRFLSCVPEQWMRIGFCFENQFSLTSLNREVWDEPVDWICVKKTYTVDYYETKVRFTQ